MSSKIKKHTKGGGGGVFYIPQSIVKNLSHDQYFAAEFHPDGILLRAVTKAYIPPIVLPAWAINGDGAA